jgi:hypothetical protein
MNKDGDVSIVGNINMLKEKKGHETGMSGASEVEYKLIQPAQVRVEFNHDKFDYRKYLRESLEKEEKKKMVAFFDLTEDN